ncbi:MAG: aspartate dehydrogenase [Hyphomicrobiaceae bacterium]
MTTKVAIAGFGAIGKVLARRLVSGMAGFELAAIGARDPERTRKIVAETLKVAVPVVPSTELAGHAAVLLECVPTPAFRPVVEPALQAGMTVISVSGAALLDNMDLADIARAGGGKLILATGAIGGLDAFRAARLGHIEKVTMVTRKPPKSLATAKDVIERNKDLMTLSEPECLFKGTAREGARRFPANVNVAAAVALAGAGPDRTMLEIWTDPAVERNTHRVIVEADTARIEFAIANVPSENPGTGRITALSMLAALERLESPIVVGS